MTTGHLKPTDRIGHVATVMKILLESKFVGIVNDNVQKLLDVGRNNFHHMERSSKYCRSVLNKQTRAADTELFSILLAGGDNSLPQNLAFYEMLIGPRN